MREFVNGPNPAGAQKTAVLLTGHLYEQKRRGSMHWLADELLHMGWSVRFVSVGYSWISRVFGDRRLRSLGTRPQVGDTIVRPGLVAHLRYTPVHPIDLRRPLLNRLAGPLMRLFPWTWHCSLRRLLRGASLVVVESGVPITLAGLLPRLTEAPLVYRVNDDINLLRMPPSVLEAETACAHLFDRISLASPVLAQRFEKHGTVSIDPMGIQKELFTRATQDPFGQRSEREVVCAGTTQFDLEALRVLATARPSWRFHVIGRWDDQILLPNVVWHGELPFRDVVPFVQHADIGLAAYRPGPGVAYQTHHSNRIIQYNFLRLPVLVPQEMCHPDFPHLIGYTLDPGSAKAALDQAAIFDRRTINIPVPGWNVLAERIAGTQRRSDRRRTHSAHSACA